MILQMEGLVYLIIGIAAVASKGDSVDAESKEGKVDFWYLWRNIEVSATAWRILRKEGTSTILSNLNTRLQWQSDSSHTVILPDNIASIPWEEVFVGPIASQNALENRNLHTRATNRTTLCCYFSP